MLKMMNQHVITIYQLELYQKNLVCGALFLVKKYLQSSFESLLYSSQEPSSQNFLDFNENRLRALLLTNPSWRERDGREQTKKAKRPSQICLCVWSVKTCQLRTILCLKFHIARAQRSVVTTPVCEERVN